MSETDMAASSGRRRLFWTLIPVFVFSALAAAMFVALRSGDPSVIPSALVGKQVPEFSLGPLEGLMRDGAPVPALSSGDLAGGEITLVNVWASWCAPCRQEHPVLMELSETGLRVVGINYKDDPENARRFLGTLGNPYIAIGADEDGRSAIDWGVYGVPETFVVDGGGVIRMKHVGPLTAAAVKERLVPVIQAIQAGE